jgi:hypothetical protein
MSASMTSFSSGARWGLVMIALCCSACGGGDNGEDDAGARQCAPLAPARGQVFEGDVFLVTPADVEAAQQYSEITGSLQVQATSEPLDVELPQLQRLGGELSADSTTLRRFAAPRLESVGGQLWFYLNAVVEIDLRNLTTVGARVTIHRNLALRALQLDALVSAGDDGNMLLNRNLQLPDCFLDVLDERFNFVRTDAPPECICTRSCGLIQAACP